MTNPRDRHAAVAAAHPALGDAHPATGGFVGNSIEEV